MSYGLSSRPSRSRCRALLAELDAELGEHTPEIPAELMANPKPEMSMAAYVRGAWGVLHPAQKLVWSWHLDAICEHLEACSTGQIRRLIINVPPGTGKSIITSVFWPTWTWSWRPWSSWLTASYGQPLATRDAVRSRRLLTSSWYRERWGHLFHLTSDQNQKTRYENSLRGWRLATSVGGSVPGERADFRLLDDPHKTDQAHLSDARREADLNWLDETWSMRETDPRHSVEVICMQRLHSRDVSGYLIDTIGDYEHLVLPMEHERERACVTSIGWGDPRTDEGELLCPERFPADVVTRMKIRLGEFGTAGQLQQRPVPAKGGIIQRRWFRFYTANELPRAFNRTIQSWDLAFKATDSSSYVAGQVWSRLGSRCYLRYRDLTRRTFTESIAGIRAVTAMYPEADEKLIEDKANGPAAMDVLDSEIPGLIAVPVGRDQDKASRMHAVSPFIQAGNVWLPDPEDEPWVEQFVTLITSYPLGASNDDGDAMAQALMHLFHGTTADSLAALEEVHGGRKDSPTAGLF
uniref:Putative terminase n=1 Tax=viral metagenome TaxID=1070528 RepID=A0A6M3J0T1_9ZZZZ